MPTKSRTTAKPAISVEHLSVHYNDAPVLQDVSFEIPNGHIAAILGPNGSGKTTLIRSMLGLTKKTSGEVRMLGCHVHEIRSKISYVPQLFQFDRQFPMTVREFMNIVRHAGEDQNLINGKILEVGLKEEILEKNIGMLSGGELQRVLIAQAILNNPDILILDEPSTGIDVVGEAAFVGILKHLRDKHGTTILLVSHDVAMVLNLVDSVVCINRTLICAGPPKRALTERKLADLYGSDAHLYEHHHEYHNHH